MKSCENECYLGEQGLEEAVPHPENGRTSVPVNVRRLLQNVAHFTKKAEFNVAVWN